MKNTLGDILKLDNSKASIKKIDLFLAGEIKYSDNYIKAITKKCLILHYLDDTNEALKTLLSYIATLTKLKPNGIISLCDGIIEICEDIKRYDQALKYIELKKAFLPVSAKNIYVKDMINLYLLEGKKDESIVLLKNYLQDDLSKDESFFAKETLANLYYDIEKYDEFLELMPTLISKYQIELDLEKIENLEIKELKIKYLRKEYKDIIKMANEILKNINDDTKIIAIGTILMNSYMNVSDYRRASIVESAYFEKLDNVEKDVAIPFIEAAISLYTKLHSVVSVKEYQHMLDELNEVVIVEATPKKKKKKKIDEDIYDVKIEQIEELKETNQAFNAPLNEIEVEKEEEYQNVYKSVKYNDVVISEYYLKIQDLIDKLNGISYDLKFREYYRQAMILLSSFFKFSDAYFLTFDKDFIAYHYKMERVYDKMPTEDELRDSASYVSYEIGSEIIINDENKEYLKDVIKNEYYDNDIYICSLPLINEAGTIASISYISTSPFLDKDMAYEGLKLVSSIINSRYIYECNKKENENKNERLIYLSNHIDMGYKEDIDGKIELSMYAKNVLGTYNNLLIDDYYSHLNDKDVSSYKAIREDLLNQKKESAELEYDFKNNDKIIRIKEKFFSVIVDGIINIISVFSDISSFDKERRDLLSLAYHNPQSKVDSEVKLMVDLNDALYDTKYALCILKVIDFDIYKELYGYNFKRQLIYALGEKLKDAIDDFNASLYHFSGSEYAILINQINDKRLVENKVKKWLAKTAKSLYELNSRVKVVFACGCYKPNKNSNKADSNTVINYALDALTSASLMKGDINFAYYDNIIAERRFKENSLVTHVSEAIDSNRLGLTYKQIVNIKKREVLGYYVDINLDNFDIDPKYLKDVAKRRGLREKIFRYTVYALFKEIKMLYDSTHLKINVFMNIDDDMLNDETVEFINERLKFYKISSKNIVFIVNDTNNKYVKFLKSLEFMIASSNILELYRNSIDYLFFDYHLVNQNSAKEIKNIADSKNITLIMSDIDDENDLNIMKNEEYEYVFGNYYKKLTRIKNIIDKLEDK